MRVDEVRANVARVFSLFAITVLSVSFLTAPVYAQDEDVADDQQDSTDEERATDEVVVTGSRLKRDTYSSISPLQVITGQVSREIGLIDPGTILQESTAASGVQIDLTFQGFVLDNGPGATTIDLRGLGASRTLVLINGRRVAPGGVEGAPVSPDINLIPGALVQQYEVLLDGASSVYGSDALAGVVNVILRKDFDGFEVEAFSSIPAQDFSAGMQNRISAAWGYNGDRGFVGIGAEVRDWEPVTLNDREWTNQCDKHFEVDENGQTRELGIDLNFDWNMRPSPCKTGTLVGRFFDFGPFGSVYYTPGSSNTGIPNFSDSGLYSVPISTGADGYNTVNWNDYSLNGEVVNDVALIIPDLQTYSALAFGEYTFSGEANITPYFEAVYARRDAVLHSGAAPFFPDVVGTNPYNPCNPDGINGVDCGLAHDNLILNDATYRAAFQDYYFGNFGCFGLPEAACLPESFGLQYGALGPLTAEPIVAVRDDRTIADTSVDQVRLVAGVRGDIPFLNFGSVEDWSFDFYLMQSESTGESSRAGIREDRLYYSLDTSRFSVPGDPSSEVICGNNDGCVPINMFAPSLYNPLLGNFATQAEKDYVWDSRDFDTEITQTLGQFYMNGELFSLPGGEALFGMGIEYRDDEIKSIPDDIARDGLFFGFFADQGAVGDKWTKEYFGELELPLLAGVTAFRELTVNVSSRHTEDEFYGKAWTYSGKLAWRPIDSLLLRGTVGTSFRAPNLRENFLLGTTGFNNGLFDPCIIPDAARNELTGGYDPALDDREPEVLANCLANGVDPTTFDNNGNSFVSAEVSSGGALDVDEEESESFSAGFTWEQPFFTSFDMVFGATYYDIDIKNEIITPSSQFIVNDCYTDLQGDSPFCSRIRRGGDGFIDFIDSGFINRDAIKARGVDVNMRVDYPTQIFGRAVDLQADFAFNRSLQLETVFLDDDGIASRDEFVGEFGYPEWKGRMSFRADYEDWRVTWSTRYISSVEQDAEGIDEFGNIVDGLANTCGGPDLGDVNCRDVGYAENYFVNDMSLYYYGDVWTLGGGIRNVFNEAPPTVDSNEVFAFNNVPFGAGYDFLGRQVFLNAVWRWD